MGLLQSKLRETEEMGLGEEDITGEVCSAQREANLRWSQPQDR